MFRFKGRGLRARVQSLMAVTAVTTLTLLTLAGCTEAVEPVKVGVLHSLTGTMAISETSLLQFHGMFRRGLNVSEEFRKILSKKACSLLTIPLIAIGHRLDKDVGYGVGPGYYFDISFT